MLVLWELLTVSGSDWFASLHSKSSPYWKLQQLHIYCKILYRLHKKQFGLLLHLILYKYWRENTPRGSVGSFPSRGLLHKTGLLHFQGLWKLSSQNLHVDALSPTLRSITNKHNQTACYCHFKGSQGRASQNKTDLKKATWKQDKTENNGAVEQDFPLKTAMQIQSSNICY